MIFVSPHACQRFAERVSPVSLTEAHAEIMSHERAITKAAEFRCDVVKLGNGARLILEGTTVKTVYARGDLPRRCRRSGGVA